MNDRYIVERIMEIIAFVIAERKLGEPLSRIELDELSRRGYTESEISAALSWILERQQAHPEEETPDTSRPASFRVLHGIEQDLLRADAWGLLLSYRDLGFLSNEDIEAILERAVLMGSEGRISQSDIKALVAAYVMHQFPTPGTGSRNLLAGNDTVN